MYLIKYVYAKYNLIFCLTTVNIYLNTI